MRSRVNGRVTAINSRPPSFATLEASRRYSVGALSDRMVKMH